jgi:surface protein
MFRDAHEFKNDSISSWDVSHVTNMARMFDGAKSFNQDLSSWNVSNVTDMSEMLRDAPVFNNDIAFQVGTFPI